MNNFKNDIQDFKNDVKKRILENRNNKNLINSSSSFLKESILSKYSYNFSWLGLTIIQYPQDVLAIQELIWRTKPDLIIEIGIARGGSIIFSASMLILCEALENVGLKSSFSVNSMKKKVIAVDIDIRKHNKTNIQKHPASKIIELIEGSSVDEKVIERIRKISKDYNNIMVILDSTTNMNTCLKS